MNAGRNAFRASGNLLNGPVPSHAPCRPRQTQFSGNGVGKRLASGRSLAEQMEKCSISMDINVRNI